MKRATSPLVFCVLGVLALALPPAAPAAEEPAAPKKWTTAEVLGAATAADWRPLDPENTFYLQLTTGRVVVELAPAFAPQHVANIKALIREGYFNGTAILRSQDNYVVQWGDPTGEKPVKGAKKSLPVELTRPAAGLPFAALPDGDVYAPEVGYSGGLPAARDPARGLAWLVHCYGMVGVGRDVALDSGSGSELYAVNGHAPRHLDSNVTLVGRVMAGMDLLSVLPRGKGDLGFYQKPEERVPILSVKMAADVPAAERLPLEILRTDTETFQRLIQARRHRHDTWFADPVGRLEVCNVPLPVRPTPASP